MDACLDHEVLCVVPVSCMRNVSPVDKQCIPNPDFPSVPFPNPEEAGALDMSMEVADKYGATLVIANDPDADRFACAEKCK